MNTTATTGERSWEIYTLTDPRDERVRYVGVTCLGTEFRLRRHLSEARYRGRKNHRCNWLRGLLAEDRLPVLEVIEIVGEEAWQEREQYWIRWHRANGDDLVNMTDGGEGCPGATYVRSDEFKAKISAAHKGRKNGPLSEERRRKIGEAHRGRVASAEARANMSRAHQGKRLSDETRAKLSAVRKGRGLKGRPVVCLETGHVYANAGVAANAMGAHRCSVYAAMKRNGRIHGLSFEVIVP